MNHIGYVKCSEKLVKVLKIILTHSHGQVSVERDFSVNKSLLVENLSMESLVFQWCAHEYMKSKNLAAENLFVCGALRKSIRASRIKYESCLEEQRKAKSSDEEASKRKVAQESISVVRKRKALVKSLSIRVSQIFFRRKKCRKHVRDETVVIRVKLF